MAVLDVCRVPVSIFSPYTSVISAITNANPVQITTVKPHGLSNGIIVRIDIATGDGMFQLNQLTGTVTVIDPTNFTIPIDTTHFDAFIIPEDPLRPGFPPNQVQVCSFVVPIGEVTSQIYNATQNIL